MVGDDVPQSFAHSFSGFRVCDCTQLRLVRLLPAHSPVATELRSPNDLHRQKIDDRLDVTVGCLHTVYDPLSHGAERGLHGVIDTLKAKVTLAVLRHRVHVGRHKRPFCGPSSWRG